MVLIPRLSTLHITKIWQIVLLAQYFSGYVFHEIKMSSMVVDKFVADITELYRLVHIWQAISI